MIGNRPKGVIPKYDDGMQENDTTQIRFLYMQLTYYNKTSKTLTTIDAYDTYLEFLNDEWHQIDEFLIVKHFKSLDIGYLCVKKDEKTMKVIKDIINNYDLDKESFVAIKARAKVMNSLGTK